MERNLGFNELLKNAFCVVKHVAIVTALVAVAIIDPSEAKKENRMQEKHPYIGMWVTGDGKIRQELLPNGRYDEARGSRKSAYQGNYQVKGNHIDYQDDTGFTADGEFRDDVLYHGGMIFYREKSKK